MSALAAYLAACARSPAGLLPCAPFACDWILERTGLDPIADLRSTWHERAVLRRIADAGGFVAMACARLDGIGLARIGTLAAGDVGLVFGARGPTLAIRTDRAWAGKGPSGITMGQFDVIAAWVIPCLR